MKKNIYFLGGFPIAGMKEKKRSEKKIMLQRQLMGYCPFESRYNGLYRDTGLGG